ncbi:MAG: hypothetical protein QHC90_05145 [Shinella sp.]|nr:hypothetical protein [Shinella sp.]
MFFIVTNKRDLTTDFVIRELNQRSLPFYRLNTEDITGGTVAFDPVSGAFAIQNRIDQIELQWISAAYFRRPEVPIVPGGDGVSGDDKYATSEWNALLKSLYLLIGDRWFSHPKDILLAEDKPSQLRLAHRVGFGVPETIITNDLDTLQRFMIGGHVIGKPLRQALVDVGGCEQVIFTSLIGEVGEADREALRKSPAIFQRHITKQFDIRVTVVGRKTFPVAIHSQDHEETETDWRRGSNLHVVHEPIRLPPQIAAACVEFVRRQNLRFGAIDLVLGQDGTYWFLECNPNGQWAWIENRTGLPIAAAIVDELLEIAAR